MVLDTLEVSFDGRGLTFAVNFGVEFWEKYT